MGQQRPGTIGGVAGGPAWWILDEHVTHRQESRLPVPDPTPAAPAPPPLRRDEERATVALVGDLPWIDAGGTRAVLRVTDAHGAALGCEPGVVLLTLDGARVSVADRNADGRCDAHDLRAGERVTVRTRLPRGLSALPATVHARLVVAHER